MFVSFQQKNEIKKGDSLKEFKHLLFRSRIDLFDIKDFQKIARETFLNGEHMTSSSTNTT